MSKPIMTGYNRNKRGMVSKYTLGSWGKLLEELT